MLPNKRVRVPRNTNDMNLGSVHSAADDIDDEDPDNEEPVEAAALDQDNPVSGRRSAADVCRSRLCSS